MKKRLRINKELVLRFNKNFYDKKIIQKSLQDFKRVCKNKIKNNQKYIVITLIPTEDIKDLSYEFCNYVFALMKNKALI